MTKFQLPRYGLVLMIVSLATPLALPAEERVGIPADWWLTTRDLEHQLSPQPTLTFQPSKRRLQPSDGVIIVEENRQYQRILGLGSSLEHSTCYNLSRLDPPQRTAVLRQLFDPRTGIGIDLARICIGTPDFTPEAWYSYDDVEPGQQDPDLSQFSIDRDRRYILPVLRQALEINPNLLFFASPWSPPGWMTTTGDAIGGSLRPDAYDAYARYFVKFIRAYRDAGIPIHAVTVQNEPGVDRSLDEPAWHYPSCRYTAEQEREFIRDHLGPAFAAAGITTEIWTYDHNFNLVPTPDGDDPGIAYPQTVLSDPAAARFVSGVAFHGYAGQPSGMSQFQQAFPGVPIHFTEGSVFGPAGGRKLIEYLRHGASSYNGWVTLLTENGKPNRGPFRASRTCVTLNPDSLVVAYHYDYYQYGHFFRFIDRGARRIESAGGDRTLGSVAVRNPDGTISVVLVNQGRSGREIELAWGDQVLETRLPARSIATVRWAATPRPSP